VEAAPERQKQDEPPRKHRKHKKHKRKKKRRNREKESSSEAGAEEAAPHRSR